MKILHYVDEANLAWGRPWVQLILELEKLGFKNTVLCPPSGTLARLLEEYSIPAVFAKANVPWYPLLCRQIALTIREIKPDIIHTRLSAAAAVGGHWGRRYGIPVVSTIDKYPKLKYYKNSTAVVGCSTAVSEHMRAIGFPPNRIATIHNPVELPLYAPRREERLKIRAKGGAAEDEIVFLGLGRLIDWKAFHTLIEACAMLRTNAPWRLWLVGDGPERQNLQGLVKKHHIENRTTFWGHASDVRPFLWGGDLFVQPSNKPEGFSLALLEALAAGLPAAATNIGGALDLLHSDAVTPFNVDDPLGLAKSLNNFISLTGEERKRLSVESVRLASDYSVEAIAERYGELYRRIISRL